MERLDVCRAKRQRLIDRLPANVELRTLGLTEVAVVFETLRVPKLQTVGAGEVPGRTRHWNSRLPEGRPGVAAASRCLAVCRAGRLSGNGQRIRLIMKGSPEVLTANRETNSASRQVEQVAAQCQVLGQENRYFIVMGGGKDLTKRGLIVFVFAERIKRRRWISIEQIKPQRVIINDAAEVHKTIALIIAKTKFPFPGGISEFAKIAFQAACKEIVVGSDFIRAQPGLQ